MDLGLNGKVAVVTGGSRGMGLAIAKTLTEEGCDVALCARNRVTLDSASAQLRDSGRRIYAHVADVTAPEGVEGFIDASAEQLGGIDCLVCSAGGGGVRAFFDSTAVDWRSTIELNLIYVVRAVQAVVPHFAKRGGGSVVLISSISGRRPERIFPDYCVAKAAEIFLASSLPWDLAPLNVRINAVSPGSIVHADSSWAELRRQDPGRYSAYEQGEFPHRRLGTAEEVANTVAFLLSSRASWITGANIAVDGAQAGGLR